MVPTWSLLAALAAGLILGAMGSRLLFRPAAVTAPAQDVPPATAAPATPLASNEPLPPPPPEHVRISMEDVVSELEHRYQGRLADKPAEKRPSSRRRRPQQPDQLTSGASAPSSSDRGQTGPPSRSAIEVPPNIDAV